MSERISVGPLADIPAGTAREIAAAGRIIALYHVDGEIYAMDGICPHSGGPLGEGSLTENIVTCPWHGWQFDVKTGHHCLNANLQQSTFAVSIEDGEIFVEIE